MNRRRGLRRLGAVTGLVFAALTTLAGRSEAHSGATALARPVPGIVVDGDLSDWPADLRRYRVGHPEYGVAPRDADDFTGTFRVAYDADDRALFVAVEVVDESVVIDTTQAAEWDTQDGCDLYLSLVHEPGRATITQYGLYGERLMYGNANFVDWHYRHGDGFRVYEWRIDLGAMRGGEAPAPGTSLGLDVVIEDKDDDGSYSWMAWSRGTRKYENPERLGDVLLLGARQPVGVLHGQVRFSGEGVAHQDVRLTSMRAASAWTQVVADGEGRFTVELPAGDWSVHAAGAAAAHTVTVAPETPARLEIEVLPPTGIVTVYGPGIEVPAAAGLRRGAWQHFGSTDGLPHSQLFALAQDGRGDLWMGRVGLSRYDGDSFVHYTVDDGLPSNVIWCLATDGDDLWIGTERGLVRFDGETFTTFTTAHGLVHDVVRSLWLDAGGDLWIGTEGGVSRWDGRRFANTTTADGLSNNVVADICRDGRGRLWVGTESGLSVWDEGDWRQLRIGGSREYDDVRSLSCGTDTVWVGTDAGLSRTDGQDLEIVFAAELADPYEAWDTYVDREGRVWLASAHGLDLFDHGRRTHFSVDDGLGQNRVYRILEDAEGSLWFAGDSGLTRYDPYAFLRLTTADGLLAAAVEALHVDADGTVWIGSDGGVQRYADGHLVTVSDVAPLREVRDIARDGAGDLWVGTTRGLSRFDGHRWRHFTVDDGLAHNWVQRVYVDAAGALWVATWGGVSHVRDGVFTNLTVESGLLHKQVWDVSEDGAGHMWFATEGGVDRYHPATGVLTHFTQADGLSHEVVRSLLRDRDGRLWAGTDGGVDVFDGTRWQPAPREHREGVASNTVWALLEDGRGHLWLGTEGGIGRYDGEVLQSLMRRDGLGNNAVRALANGIDGDVWIGTLGGVTRYRARQSSPQIRVRQVVADRRYDPDEEIAFSGPRSLVAFEFSGRSYKTRADAVVYRYRLRGHDDDWRTTRQRRVEVRDLPLGDYLFEVEAIDRDLSRSSTPARVALTVHPAYAWLGLWGVLVVVVVVSGWQARGIWQRNRRLRDSYAELTASNRALQAAVAEKEVLIKEVHHRVKNNMQVISSLLNLRSRATDDEALSELIRESQERIQTMALVHEQLYQSPSLAQIDVEAYLQQLVGNIRAYDRGLGNVELEVEVEGTPSLNLERATSCGLVINELISNCLKHAFPDGRAGRVRVEARQEGEHVVFAVADDGVGLPPGTDFDRAETLGLQLVSALTRQLHAQMVVRTEGGTRVELRFRSAS